MLSIQEMLSRSARDFPGKAAVVSQGKWLSYAELEDSATRIAAYLHSRGIGKGMRVAIYSSKCVEEAALIFGTAKAGCVLVHINPAFRDDKVCHLMAECEPAAFFFHPCKARVVEQVAQKGLLPPLLVRMLPGRDTESIASVAWDEILGGTFPGEHSFSSPDEGDLAAIIYTSGTTASAKGIMVTHQILSQATLVSAQLLENVLADRLISVTPFSFDGALSQLFTATLTGGTLVLQESPLPKDVVLTLLRKEITGFHAVPSLWRMILERYPAIAQLKFPHLRYLSLIGEVFPEKELARLKRILKDTQFFLMYGTTEAFRSTCLTPAEFARKGQSVGKPLPGVSIKVVDERGSPCPTGVIGEIVHSGAFVSPGYWRRKGDTVFQPDGVHTGDLGMFDEDGYLYYIGRRDNMIKRLGYQVYPEEIEACLAALDGVAMAVVVCVPDGASGPRIHAFLVPRWHSGLTRDVVTRHCKAHLPYYMMPDEISFRSALPMTGNCKIDRTRLSLPEGA